MAEELRSADGRYRAVQLDNGDFEVQIDETGEVVWPPTQPQFPSKLVSPDGRVELDIQNADALNMTLYLDGVALWSILTGPTAEGRAKGVRF